MTIKSSFLPVIGLLFAAISTMSCNLEINLEEAGNEDVVTFTCVIEPDTKLAVSEGGKTTWEVGDKILINAGSNGNTRETVTLKASDISDDGKKATIAISIPPYEHLHWETGLRDDVSTYYAMYPADAVAPKALYYNQAFSNTNALLMAGCNKDKTIVFYNVCGIISFTVSGDFDSYVFSGNNGETVAYEVYQCRVRDTGSGPVLTSPKTADSYPTLTPQATVRGTVTADGKTINYVCIPNGVSFTGGFTFKFYKGSSLVKVAKSNTAVSIGRKKMLPLGSITGSLADPSESETHQSSIPTEGATDLSAGATANCYIVSQPGIYKLKAVKGNSNNSVGEIASTTVVWETWCSGETVTEGSVVKAVDYQEDYVYIQIADNYHPGNALVAAKNSSGKILWSWHIWAPESEIGVDTYSISSSEVMDRNLGALVPAPSGGDGRCFGLLYQWGRKDPFPGMVFTSSSKVVSVAGTETSILTQQITLDASIAQPTVYATIQNGDWCSTSNDDFWGKSSGKKSIYDPCPPGYKVPLRSEAGGLFTSLPDTKGWENIVSEGYFKIGNPVATFPYAGYVDDYITSPGSYAYPGQRALIWSGDGSSAKAYGQDIRADKNPLESSAKSDPKARGASVRCINESMKPFENEAGMPVQGSYVRTVYSSTVNELSGLCFSKDKDFIWGVGDEGALYKFGLDLNYISTHWTHSADMEDVTLDPSTGNLLIAIESEQKIYRVNAPNYNTYSTIFYIQDAVDAGMDNSGLEGIAYYKDNMFYVGAQSGATLWKYNLDGTKIWKKQLGSLAPGIVEVGGLCYDAGRDELWLTDSEAFKLFVFDGEVTRLKAIYNVSFVGNPESVLVDSANGCVYVGDDGDTSKIYKISFTNL